MICQNKSIILKMQYWVFFVCFSLVQWLGCQRDVPLQWSEIWNHINIRCQPFHVYVSLHMVSLPSGIIDGLLLITTANKLISVVSLNTTVTPLTCCPVCHWRRATQRSSGRGRHALPAWPARSSQAPSIDTGSTWKMMRAKVRRTSSALWCGTPVIVRGAVRAPVTGSVRGAETVLEPATGEGGCSSVKFLSDYRVYASFAEDQKLQNCYLMDSDVTLFCQPLFPMSKINSIVFIMLVCTVSLERVI